MKKMILKKRRFTVLEMMVSMGLLSVIMFALLSMLDQSQRAMTTGVSKMEVTEEARIVLDQLENDITCVDYLSADKKLRDMSETHRISNLKTDVLSVKSDGAFVVHTSRPGKLPRFCKVIYELDGYELKMNVWTYDDKENSFKKEDERILLTNVLKFNVKVENYELTGYEYPKKVTVELKLLDNETRRLGYVTKDDRKKRKINIGAITDKLKDENALEARAARFSRVISLEPPEL